MSAWAKGYQDFENDIQFEENPYEDGSEDYLEWISGWFSSCDDFQYSLEHTDD